MDYEALRFIWWVLIGVLLIGFVVTDGFDMGVASLLKIIGKSNDERRVMINSIAPHWDGNQVWLVTAGGALFAAWPTVYAASFSGFYIAMMLTLFALFLRPLAFEYRSKIDNELWRSRWDWALTAGSAIPALIFGVAFGNLLQGVPFHFDDLLRLEYTGSFWALLNPFALLAGVLSLLMIVNHGATYLQLKTEGQIKARAEAISSLLALVCAVVFVMAGGWLWVGIDGYIVTSVIDTNGGNRTVEKTVEIMSGAWFINYGKAPLLWAVPALGVICFLLCALFSKARAHAMAFVSSGLAMAMVLITTGISMFPFVMPSSSMPNHSLTMWDATASETTLFIMFCVACVFVPLILGYTAWGYFVMRGRLNEQHIRDNTHSMY
ncbi:MAG: cytochrome d ubiquinol oxidase subunit II [Pseudomonadales bacterium]|jgi:cytochrome bd ubiquinol oxidase subunit II|nr:cytochrome d ubiquinol oxidase subunit II [Pseudomonadales bacterium]HBT58970.1 cytochrome d ubiquinol oxidase subunit II [Pseudomonas sp.]MAK73935.1 cytochrome d ubiquinol oxidase subunit II [Pseudomonadales bacterium]MAP76550.1 cytochrome d ubiquinol oxidase subunit II [Pseudomonadales bacterium]MAS67505.1 cytochrome d ubiquinol oxidase subunit II [Pseudomonadales bacterium]|tara:strand:+ start:6619 stop:7755 length:1137 start_codon:yes stop_codon:yes gene_type:complete